MVALSKDRSTIERAGTDFGLPVAGGQKIHKGALVCRNATGFAVKGIAAAGLVALGRAHEAVDNSGGADGDESVRVVPGVYRWENSAGADEIGAADVGGTAWIVDDQTVARTPGNGARSPAGRITAVDDSGVWVDTRPGAAEPRRVHVPVPVKSLIGANAAVYRFAAPVAGVITKIRSVLGGALAAGDATLTAKVGAAAVTNGVVTITQAGSAAGDVDAAAPSAGNTVAEGDVVSLTVGGTNTADVGADVLVEILY